MLVFDPMSDHIYLVGRRVFTEFVSGPYAWSESRVKSARVCIVHEGEPVVVSEIAGQYCYLTSARAADSEHTSKDLDVLFKLTAGEKEGVATNPNRGFDQR